MVRDYSPLGELIRYGSSVSKELLDIPVEQFLSMLRFESKGKLDDLGPEIDTILLEI